MNSGLRLKGAKLFALVFLLGLVAPLSIPRAASPAPRAYLQIFCQQFSREDSAIPAGTLRSLKSPRKKEARDPQGDLWRVSPEGLTQITADGRTKVWSGREGLPARKALGVSSGADGRVWVSAADGVVAMNPQAAPRDRWFCFRGRRYLRDDSVESLVAEDGGAWVCTRTGISHIEFKPFDLEQKSALFLRRVEQRHNRYGYVADCDLLRPGDLSSHRPVPSDNDGLWTSLYVASECFRYAATHSPEALRNARASLAALRRLESITGISGFPARTLIHRGDYRDQGGEWHFTPDGEWEWKGDTSSDELVGHFFAYATAYDLLPDESDRRAITPVVSRIASHLLDHGMKLVGYGGRVTRWGNYSPEYFLTREGEEEAPLSSLELLSHLKVAYHVTQEEKFNAAYQRLITELGYASNVSRLATEAPAEVNYSDEELALLSFYPLLRLEDNPTLRGHYVEALKGLWQRVRPEHNPLWNFIYAASTGDLDYGRDDAVDTLERIPLDTISWTVKNSERADLDIPSRRGRFGEKQAPRAIPSNERAVMKWNGNPFELDGGNAGRSEDDGVFYLLPYWMGRYHRIILL